MKTTTAITASKAGAISPVTVITPSAYELPDVWLSPRELGTLRKSISAQTLQDLFDYHEDLWGVVCTSSKLDYLGYAETGQVPQLDTFVRMLIADSLLLRGEKLKAAQDAQGAVHMANWAIRDDPLWKLDGSAILATKP